jgi:hypothetical protein
MATCAFPAPLAVNSALTREPSAALNLIDRPGRAVRSVSSSSGSQDRRSSVSANAAYSRSIEHGTVLLAPPANEPPARAGLSQAAILVGPKADR